MQFKQIVGHNNEKELLKSFVQKGQIPHATLLYGPPGIGKMSLARAFVQYICCSSPQDGDSCGKCPNCIQTSKLNNPDIHYVFPVIKKGAAGNPVSEDFIDPWRKFITEYPFMPVEKWQELIEAGSSQPLIYVYESDKIIATSSLSAYAGKYKIFLIWLPEKMNKEAANKLLKVIEEPFEDTLFVLVSNDPASILPTVRSRLRGVEVMPMTDDEIQRQINFNGMERQDVEAVTKISKRNMNRVMELISDGGEIAEFASLFIDTMRNCYTRNLQALRNLSEKAASFGREKEIRLLAYFNRMIRESFLSNLKNPALLAMTHAEKEFTGKFGPFIHAGNVELMMKSIDKASLDISRNANQKIVWFDLMILLKDYLRIKKPA